MSAERHLAETLDRRELLRRLSVSALILGAHETAASGTPGPGSGPDRGARTGGVHGSRIVALRLETGAPLDEMESFYGDLLGLPVDVRPGERLSVSAGATELVFVPAAAGTAPFYHFAFNIPENTIRAARAWQLERSPLFITPPNLRDPDYPSDVRHFRNWNAHSVFFWDPAGNVLEYIARHDLGNRADGPFSSADILYASEIAFVVDEVPGTAAALQDRLDLHQYRDGSDVFWASGDEHGLLLLFKRGREIGDRLRGRPAPAEVFRTHAEIRGSGAGGFEVPGYPHQIVTRG